LKAELTAHHPTGLPDPANRYPQAIANAIRWLNRQPQEQMIGDDAVGWWLLMETGRYPRSNVLSLLASKLDTLSKGTPLISGTLYTFTVIARTLKRAGYPLETFPLLQQTWKRTVDRASVATNDVNFIWLMQMAAELWPSLTSAHRKSIQEVALIKDSKLMIPASAVVVLDSLEARITKGQVNNITRLLSNATTTGVIDEIPDWHLGYVVWALLACKEYEAADKLGMHLLEHQKEGAWDESSEESVESTSICGLALLDLNSCLHRLPNWALSRSMTIHQTLLLLDFHNWLLSNWLALGQMPKDQSKGPALEQFVAEWVGLDESLVLGARDLRGGTDEIDLVLDVSKNPTLTAILKQAQFVLLECKNTSEPVSAKEIRAFRDSLRIRRKDNCRLGVVVSPKGFTADAKRTVLEDPVDDQLVLLLDGEMVSGGLHRRAQLSDLLFSGVQDRIVKRT
jgi:Restriction endonuclease